MYTTLKNNVLSIVITVLILSIEDLAINVDEIQSLPVQQVLEHDLLVITAIWMYQYFKRPRVHAVLIDYLEKFLSCMY